MCYWYQTLYNNSKTVCNFNRLKESCLVRPYVLISLYVGLVLVWFRYNLADGLYIYIYINKLIFEPQDGSALFQTNAFEIGHAALTIRGIYPTAFLMSHNCVPNTIHYDYEPDFRLKVVASTFIGIGEPITLSYSHTLHVRNSCLNLLPTSSFINSYA